MVKIVLINAPRYARGSVNRPNVINDIDLPIVDPQIRAGATYAYREIRYVDTKIIILRESELLYGTLN